MNTEETSLYDIIGGPDTEAMTHLRVNDTVDFTVVAAYTEPPGKKNRAYIKMVIQDIEVFGLEFEDGSGVRFNLHGHCKADPNCRGDNPDLQPHWYQAFYDSKKHQGMIYFL